MRTLLWIAAIVLQIALYFGCILLPTAQAAVLFLSANGAALGIMLFMILANGWNNVTPGQTVVTKLLIANSQIMVSGICVSTAVMLMPSSIIGYLLFVAGSVVWNVFYFRNMMAAKRTADQIA